MMNAKQIGVMWIGILAIGALLLYPPYVMMPDMGAALKSQFAGLFGAAQTPHAIALVKYGFLFTPPDGSLSIDGARQWPPIVFLALLTIGLMATLRERAGLMH